MSPAAGPPATDPSPGASDRPSGVDPRTAAAGPPATDPSPDPSPASSPDRAPAPASDAASPPAPAMPAIPPDDLPCIRCGYALTGLPADGDCPECGTSVRQSLDGDLIARADPAWLDRTERGLRLLRVGLSVAVGSAAAFLVILVGSLGLSAIITRPPWLETATGIILDALGYGMLLGALAAVAGGWLVTSLEPRDVDREQLRDPRPTARWGPVIAVGLAVAAFIARTSLPAPHDQRVSLGLFLGVAVAAGLGLAALHERFRRLAVRVPSEPVAERCTEQAAWFRRTGRTVAIAIAVRFAVSFLPASVTSPPPGAGPGPGLGPAFVQLVDAVATLAVMVAVLATMIRTPRLARLARDLRHAIRTARAEASVPPPGPTATT